MEKDSKHSNELKEKKITRKQAIKKAGLATFSAATLMVLLSEEVTAGRGSGRKCGGGGHSSPSGSSSSDGWGGHSSSSSDGWGKNGSSD